MRDAASRRRRASSPGTARASSRALLNVRAGSQAIAAAGTIDVGARPELEADERPETLGVIACAGPMLLDERGDLVRPCPPALTRSRIVEDVARPVDHLILEPAAEWHTESALRAIEHRGRHPWPDDFSKQALGDATVEMTCR